MIVKDIIKNTAKLLNLTDVLEYYKDETVSPSDDVTNTISDLLLAVNTTNNCVASLYFELTSSSNVSSTNGVIPFSSITSKDIVEIKDIKDSFGNDVKYKILSDGIHILDGNYVVSFSYLPEEVAISDDINYYQRLNTLMFSYGVAGEYLFLKGNVEEAYIWDKRFKDLLFVLSRPKRNINMPSERWY